MFTQQSSWGDSNHWCPARGWLRINIIRSYHNLSSTSRIQRQQCNAMSTPVVLTTMYIKYDNEDSSIHLQIHHLQPSTESSKCYVFSELNEFMIWASIYVADGYCESSTSSQGQQQQSQHCPEPAFQYVNICHSKVPESILLHIFQYLDSETLKAASLLQSWRWRPS